ncbi:MAG: GTP cyclohydrolase I, partial [Flavobacteriales bacterium]
MNAYPPLLNEETTMTTSQKKIADAVGEILHQIGEDVSRQGLLKTPERVAKAYGYLTKGYEEDASAIIRGAMFDESYSEMVLVKDIELYS